MLLGSGVRVVSLGTKDGLKTYAEQDGVVRRVAPNPPPFPCLNHPNAPQSGPWDFTARSGTDGGTKCPVHYNRSQSALFWSLKDLIENDTCYLWTVTARSLVPDSWFGNMHSRFMKNMNHAARDGKIHEWWGGVRVFEPHPGGHGLHSHLVLKNRMPWRVVEACAHKAGLGRINVHNDPVGIGAIYYLAEYLGKSAKEMSGVRRWACVGTYDGVGKRDVVFSGSRIDRIKALAEGYRLAGRHRYAAYRFAVMQVQEEERDALWGPREKPRSGKIFTLDNGRII